MPRRVGDFRGLTQPSRLRLLGAVQESPGCSAAALAAELRMPLNTLRDHLHVLEAEGLIRAEPVHRATSGRPTMAYHPVREAATSTPAEERVSGARQRGAMLRAVTADPDAAVLGGDAEAQLDVLYEHLDDAGLEPAIDEQALTVELAPCRYHAMIDDDQALVCSVHARLVGDVLRQVDGPLALKRLDPFVTEHSCRLMLTSREGS